MSNDNRGAISNSTTEIRSKTAENEKNFWEKMRNASASNGGLEIKTNFKPAPKLDSKLDEDEDDDELDLEEELALMEEAEKQLVSQNGRQSESSDSADDDDEDEEDEYNEDIHELEDGEERSAPKTLNKLTKHKAPFKVLTLKDISCSECGEILKTKSGLTRHMTTKHNKKLGGVSTNQAATRSKSGKKAIHKTSVTFTCPICLVKFVARSDLKKHLEQLHEGASVLKCETCERYVDRESKQQLKVIDCLEQKPKDLN